VLLSFFLRVLPVYLLCCFCITVLFVFVLLHY